MRTRKAIAVTAAVAALGLGGCHEIRLGGWIESLEDSSAKATFGGQFSCTPQESSEAEGYYEAIYSGEFNYTDHGYMIRWNGRDDSKKLSFHSSLEYGLFDTIGFDVPPEEVCAVADAVLEERTGFDVYCGPATLQPAPKTAGDFGYGDDLYFGILIEDDGEPGPSNGDSVAVLLGTDPNEGACPTTFLYENDGTLQGGNVQVFLP